MSYWSLSGIRRHILPMPAFDLIVLFLAQICPIQSLTLFGACDWKVFALYFSLFVSFDQSIAGFIDAHDGHGDYRVAHDNIVKASL